MGVLGLGQSFPNFFKRRYHSAVIDFAPIKPPFCHKKERVCLVRTYPNRIDIEIPAASFLVTSS